MADSLREAAEKTLRALSACSGAVRIVDVHHLQIAEQHLRSALSAPDPVAEAREILKQIADMTTKRQLPLTAEINDLCRDWLKRNGGTDG